MMLTNITSVRCICLYSLPDIKAVTLLLYHEAALLALTVYYTVDPTTASAYDSRAALIHKSRACKYGRTAFRSESDGDSISRLQIFFSARHTCRHSLEPPLPNGVTPESFAAISARVNT